MKKVILSAMVVLFSTTAFANKAKVTKFENAENLSISINVSSLEDYLSLNSLQTEEVECISDYFEWQLNSSRYKKADRKKATIKKAVYVNLKSMKNVLTETQYKMYLQLMNTTLKNKRLWDYVVSNS